MAIYRKQSAICSPLRKLPLPMRYPKKEGNGNAKNLRVCEEKKTEVSYVADSILNNKNYRISLCMCV